METETTIFIYDAVGKQIAQYSDVVANSPNAEVADLTDDHSGCPPEIDAQTKGHKRL